MPSTASIGAQQIGELRAVLPGTEIAAVGVHVLAEQGDLDHTVAGELFDLVHDVAHAAADFFAPHRRHDAERARVVAADLDRDPRRSGRPHAGPAAPTDTRRALRGSRPADPRRVPGPGARARWPGCACRTRHRRAARAPARDSRSFWARQPPTAICRSGRRFLQLLEPAEVPVELVVGVLADAARVEHDHVGRSRGRRSAPCRRSTSSPAIRSESCSFIWHP